DALVPRLRLAEALLEQQRLDEAQAQLDDVIQVDPDNQRARLDLGRLAWVRQQWRTALDQLEACLNNAHARRLAHSLRAEAWLRLEQPERARAEREQAADLLEDEPWPDPFFDEVMNLQRGLRSRLSSART